MLTIRKATDRGRTNIGWLDSWHTFSFGEYHDPNHMAFRELRVINDDIVAPGQGFGLHPHRDMEIITVILDGVLHHRDSLGSQGEIRPGEVQVMTAGSGIRHSEFNGSADKPVHLLQIWIMPEARSLPPAYAQKAFTPQSRKNKLATVASRAGQAGSSGPGPLKINQDVDVMVGDLDAGATVRHTLRPGRAAWIQIATGSAVINGTILNAGDAAAIEDETDIKIEGKAPASTVLVFDLN